MKKVDTSSKDESQEAYRKHFGIIDKSLIEQEMTDGTNGKSGFIVYIDFDNDIDWVDLRDDAGMTEEQKRMRNNWLAKLNVLQARPHGTVGEEDALTYMKMLGAAYVLVMRNNNIGFVSPERRYELNL